MGYLFCLVIGAVAGFVVGFLFYRKNTDKLKAGEQILRKEDK